MLPLFNCFDDETPTILGFCNPQFCRFGAAGRNTFGLSGEGRLPSVETLNDPKSYKFGIYLKLP